MKRRYKQHECTIEVKNPNSQTQQIQFSILHSSTLLTITNTKKKKKKNPNPVMTRKCERREKENSLTASLRHPGSNLVELMGSTRLEIEM